MHQIAQMISELSRSRIQYITDSMQPYELKACYAVNLSHICSRPGIPQDTLARLRLVDKSSIARQVATMEDEGFITRIPCNDDKRVMKLYPTDKALELLPKITQIMEYWEDLLTQDLSEEEIDTLTALLEKMKKRAAQWKEAD